MSKTVMYLHERQSVTVHEFRILFYSMKHKFLSCGFAEKGESSRRPLSLL